MPPRKGPARLATGRVAFALLTIVLALGLSCSDDESSPTSGSNPPPSGEEGTFVDSPVQGLEYASGAESGLTASDGRFAYDRHEDVQFKCGDIVLGQAPPAAILSPLHIVLGATQVTDNSVTNIARFLQTIDDDANPDNGIVITDGVRTAAAGQSLDFLQDPTSFEDDPGVQAVISALTAQTSAGARSLVGASEAQAHLEAALLAAYANTYNGRTCLDLDTGAQRAYGTWEMVVQNDGQFTLTFFRPDSNIWFTVTGEIGLDGSIFVTGGVGQPSVYATVTGGRWYYYEYEPPFDQASGSFSVTTSCN